MSIRSLAVIISLNFLTDDLDSIVPPKLSRLGVKRAIKVATNNDLAVMVQIHIF